jgi:hypothetical protein
MPERFVADLAGYRHDAVFNPWGESDREHDCGPDGAQIRRRQLSAYLEERIGRATVLLLAEAIGYQGGHFSGIPMTSERLLLGGLRHRGICPEAVFELQPQRTSSPAVKPAGFTEPTATIVWGLLSRENLDPRSIILWNAFPWHPFQRSKGLLSNRTPTDQELHDGHLVLRQLLDLARFETVIAVGRKSALQLERLAIPAHQVRHPANGGAGQFLSQMKQILSSSRV